MRRIFFYARLRSRDPCPRILHRAHTVVQRYYRPDGPLDECVEALVELAEVSKHQRLHLAELIETPVYILYRDMDITFLI